MHKEADIAHENATHWVLRKGPGHFEVYRSGLTHSTRCAIVHFSSEPNRALARAITEADRRHAGL